MHQVYRIAKTADINEISAEVSLSTIGVASSLIKQIKSNVVPVTKAASGKDDGGNIGLTSIGSVADLKGSTIKFRTSVFFPQEIIPAEQLREKITLLFSLRGGDAGTVTYKIDASDTTVLSRGKLVIFEKTVKLF